MRVFQSSTLESGSPSPLMSGRSTLKIPACETNPQRSINASPPSPQIFSSGVKNTLINLGVCVYVCVSGPLSRHRSLSIILLMVTSSLPRCRVSPVQPPCLSIGVLKHTQIEFPCHALTCTHKGPPEFRVLECPRGRAPVKRGDLFWFLRPSMAFKLHPQTSRLYENAL